MSFGARLSIAVIFAVVGAGCGYAAIACPDSNARRILWPAAVLCFVIVASCFPGRHSAVANRIVGAVVFLTYVAYLIAEIKEGVWISSSSARPSVVRAVLGLMVWGLPAGYVMIHGHLPYNPFASPHVDEEDAAESYDANRRYLRR